MKLVLQLLFVILSIISAVYGWYNLCPNFSEKGLNLQFDSKNCPILHHVKTDKKHRHQPLRGFQLHVDGNVEKLKLSLKENEWKSAIFKISPYNNNINNITSNNNINLFCGEIANQNISNLWQFNCLGISRENLGQAYLFEYKITESLDEISKKIVFFIPKFTKRSPPLNVKEIFTTLDFTDTSILVLKIQPLEEFYKVAAYKIEVWRNRHLEDVRMVSPKTRSLSDFITFEYHTYNEEGSYHFLTSAINDECLEDVCLKSATPEIAIGRKNTPLVVGIVCASLILPFVMFSLHYLIKKLKLLDGSATGKKILIVYQSADPKHNAALLSFGRFLEMSTSIEVNYDEIPRFRDNNLERLCLASLAPASDLVYVLPPTGQYIQQIDFKAKEVAGKRITCVCFRYCDPNNLPAVLSDHPQFKIPEQIDAFLAVFGDFKTCRDEREYANFLKKLDEVDDCTEDNINKPLNVNNDVPVIIVTDPEPHEEDKLLGDDVDHSEDVAEK